MTEDSEFDSRKGKYFPLLRILISSVALSTWIKQPAREADNSTVFIPGVKNKWSYTPYIFMAWRLIKHKDNFMCTHVQGCDGVWFSK
jgi:hypothetical protein